MVNPVWSLVIGGVTSLAMILVGFKYKVGWALNGANQLLYMVYALATWQPGFLTSSSVVLVISVANYWKWYRQEKGAPHAATECYNGQRNGSREARSVVG